MNMGEWNGRNDLLQEAYRAYLHASKQKEKDAACERIQMALEWNPLMNYCYDAGGVVSGISKYGLDSITEKCIRESDEIAMGERNYDY